MGFQSAQARDALRRHATLQEAIQALLEVPEPSGAPPADAFEPAAYGFSESEEDFDEEPPKAGKGTDLLFLLRV